MKATHLTLGIACTLLIGACTTAPDGGTEPVSDAETTASSPEPARSYSPESRDLSQADIERLMEELSNWGRWGDDDQLGAANLITPEKRLEALALATEGISVSLAHRLITEEAVDVPLPFERAILRLPDPDEEPGFRGGVSDRYEISYHGYSPQPHRLAVSHPLQGEDVQRLLAGHGHRGRLHAVFDRQPPGRHRHQGHRVRHPPPEGRALA